MICKIYRQLFSEGLLWMDATTAKWENVCMSFGWTDPLTLHLLLAGVWLEIRVVKATAMWPSWSSTTCSPTSSVTNLKWSFDMNTHWYKLNMFIVLHCAFCHVVHQVWVPLVGQTGGRRQTLSWCVVTAVGPRCLSGRAATLESSHRTPSWRGQF